MKFVRMTVAALALGAASPAAFAQAPITVGMQVTDATGAPVGTVTAIQGDNLMVKTDRHETLIGKASVTPSGGKLLFGLTQAQLNAEIENGLAAAAAAVAPGASVKGLQGTAIGTIESVSADGIVIALPSGKKVQVAASAARGNADGTVTIGATADQIAAQVQPDAGTDAQAEAPAAGSGD